MSKRDEDMSCTEKLPLKITVDAHASLSKLACAHGLDMQSLARRYIDEGISRDVQVITVGARLFRGEEIVGNLRGNRK